MLDHQPLCSGLSIAMFETLPHRINQASRCSIGAGAFQESSIAMLDRSRAARKRSIAMLDRGASNPKSSIAMLDSAPAAR